jgi:hypothetical protein
MYSEARKVIGVNRAGVSDSAKELAVRSERPAAGQPYGYRIAALMGLLNSGTLSDFRST